MTGTTQGPHLDRRRVLGCAALFGIAGPLLVSCGTDEPQETSPRTPGRGLVAAADVPVGGGVILKDAQIVVTQPTEGNFKGFTSVCTHQGNPLGAVGEGKITCAFHGSQFSVADGANVTGPNGSAGGSVPDLTKIPVKVVDGRVVKA